MRFVRSEWWTDDTVLLQRVEDAVLSAREVPAEFIAAGKAVWVPPDLDAELAALIYDSRREPVGVRTDTAALRALTFASATQTVELEIVEGRLLGQLVPPGQARIEIQLRDGDTAATVSDELGYFVIPFVPSGAFRLRYRSPAATEVVTSWVTI